MRRIAVLTGVLAMTLTATMAHAGSYTFGLKGGGAIPTGDLGDVFDAGPAVGVFADYWMSPTMGFGADIAGDFYSGDVGDEMFPGQTFEAKFTVIQFGVHATNMFAMKGSTMAPYIQYGVAAYNGQTKVEDLDIDESSTKFGLNGGVGVDFPVGAMMKLGVGGEYHYIFLDENEDFAKSATDFRIMARLTFMTGTN